MKKFALVILVAVLSQFFGGSTALAMGSGNPYQDAQTGLSYQIWQPGAGSTKDLTLASFKLLSCGAKKEEWVSAKYGEDRSVQFLETDAAVKCSNPGVGKTVANVLIKGRSAKVVAFCDVSHLKILKACSISDIHNFGGYAIWNTHPTKLLRATTIEVLVSGLTYTDLLRLSHAMVPVSKS